MNLTREMSDELSETYANAVLSNTSEQTTSGFFSIFHPFESVSDFQGDLNALFIKPISCCYLSWVHAGRALYESVLTLGHLLTLSRDTSTHFRQIFNPLIKSCCLAVWCCAVLCKEALSFTMRCIISLGVWGVRALATEVANIFTPERHGPSYEASWEARQTYFAVAM